MNKVLKVFIMFCIMIFLTNCGGSNTSTTSDNNLTIIDNQGTAQLGNLANAKVEIYRVEKNNSMTLLWTETTTDGNSLDKIGKFPLHEKSLENNKIYLYKISGGKDWDADDNGIKDNVATDNKGIIRALVNGSQVKSLLNKFKVTVLTELVYQKTLPYLSNTNNLTYEQNKLSQNLVDDLNNDGKIDYIDILNYDPSKDNIKEILYSKNDIKNIIELIHKSTNNKSIFMLINKVNKIVSESNISSYPNDMQLSSDGKKIYVLDNTKFKIINISNSNYEIEDEIDLNSNGRCYQLKVSKNMSKAYITCNNNDKDTNSSLLVLDIENPNNISLLSKYNNPTGYFDITLFDNDTKAITTLWPIWNSTGKIEILDISNPAQINKITDYNTTRAWRTKLSQDETKLFVSTESGIDILDITNLSNITKLSGIDIYSATGIAGIMSDLTLTSDEKTIFASYGANQRGLVSIDIHDIEHPKILDYIEGNLYYASITLSNDEKRLYCSGDDDEESFLVIDVSNPKDIKILSSIPQLGQKIILSKDNTLGYYFYDGKFKAINLLSIENSATLYSKRFFTVVRDYKKSKVSNYIYATGTRNEYSSTGQLKIFKYDNDKNLTELSSINLNGEAQKIIFNRAETLMFIAGGSGSDDYGLYILNITDKNNPEVISHFTSTNFWPRDIILSNDEKIIYALGYNYNAHSYYVYKIDISDTNSPQIIEEEPYSNALQISWWDNKIFLTQKNGFTVINPSNLSNTNSYTSAQNTYDSKIFIDRKNNLLYFSQKTITNVFDLQNINDLTIKKSFHTNQFPSVAFFYDNYILFGTYEGIERVDLINDNYYVSTKLNIYGGMNKSEEINENKLIGGYWLTKIIDISQLKY